jgi:hypothetical protein
MTCIFITWLLGQVGGSYEEVDPACGVKPPLDVLIEEAKLVVLTEEAMLVVLTVDDKVVAATTGTTDCGICAIFETCWL